LIKFWPSYDALKLWWMMLKFALSHLAEETFDLVLYFHAQLGDRAD
jgi:hypothetical protein